ncbi:MAG: methionine biosynthesis protein MetW [Deltaproteobacteria bacterium]|nr:methionine biosynthesis protein MetW [Deltaproteobacteria bacterium]
MIDREDKALAELGRIHHPAGALRLPPAEPTDTVEMVTGRVPVGRWDHELIERIVASGTSVLDLGCGRGSLLHALRVKKGVRGQGVEKDPEKLIECVARGVPVIHGDLDAGLLGTFPRDAFDYVVLEMTLQTVKNPRDIMLEMLRVGRVGVVSFPNFGHWRVREQLLRDGRTPVTDTLPFRWYDTPNIRVLTIRDFEEFCEANEVHVLDRYVLAGGRYRRMASTDNVVAEEALYIVCGAESLTEVADGGGI